MDRQTDLKTDGLLAWFLVKALKSQSKFEDIIDVFVQFFLIKWKCGRMFPTHPELLTWQFG